jgi:[ribosomal protein S5]-alanine N-acetyltransferase
LTDILKTRRLRLLPHAAEHLRALIGGADSYRAASGLTPANGLREFVVSKDVSADWLAALQMASGCDPWTYGFALVCRESNTVIGNASFVGPPVDGVVEIAYGIVPDQQGKGFATEAADALVEFARRSGRVKTIRAHTLPARNASTSVLEKCGFHRIADMNDPVDGPIWRWERTVP